MSWSCKMLGGWHHSMKKKILLTGATGFVGSNLLALLLEKGFEVACLLRQKNGLESYQRLYQVLSNGFTCQRQLEHILSQVQIVQGDITQERLGLKTGTYRTLQKEVNTIFHCAALTDFHSSLSQEQLKCNVQGIENMIRFALKGSAVDGFHYISTAYVAGDRTGVIYEGELDKGQGFNNGYEQSKFIAEKILHEYRERTDLKITIYRPSIIVGHSQTGKTTLFNGMYLFLRLLYLLKKRFHTTGIHGKTLIPLRVVGKPHTTKNFVHIDYVIRLIMKIFLNASAQGKTYHLINATPPTLYVIKEVMEEILAIKGIQFVNQEAFTLTPPTRTEQLFAKETESYRTYMFNEPLFDDRMAQELRADDSSLTCTLHDRAALANLFTYAISSSWGRRENRECDVWSADRNSCVHA